MMKDYDYENLYHTRKANVVADGLSRKMEGAPIRDIGMRMTMISPLLDMIKEAQVKGVKKENWKIEKIRGQYPLFVKDSRGLLTQCGRVWVPVTGGVRQRILEEAYKSNFSIHPRPTKMYRDLRLSYWWPYMKRKIAWFVERCLTCRKVKSKHQRPHGKV